jgi:hypothetical protein
MLKVLVLLILTASLTACSRWLVDSSVIADSPNYIMSTTSAAAIQSVTLSAREARLPAPGRQAPPDRAIGFADLLLELENPLQAPVTVTIQAIQIRAVDTGEVQMERSTPETVVLKPLENAVTDLHLTNRTGYRTGDRVKAVVTYRIGDQELVIESNPVEIMHP